METTHNDERTELEKGLKNLATKARSGQLFNARLLGLVVVSAGLLALWWYLQGSTRKSDVESWKALDTAGATAESLETFAATNPRSSQGRVARLQQARILLVNEGIPNLTMPVPAEREKGIANIEKARTILLELAEELTGDTTLRGQAIEAAAKAELSLVGIPKTPGGTDYRGSIEKAIELLKKFVGILGETTPVGEATVKKIKDLEANKDQVMMLASSLNLRYGGLSAAPKVEEPKLPQGLQPNTPAAKPDEPKAPAPAVPQTSPAIPPATPAVPPPAVPPPAAPPTTK